MPGSADPANSVGAPAPGETLPTVPASLKAARDELARCVLDGSILPDSVPEAYSALADRWLAHRFEEATRGRERGYALLAVGGYGRRLLCPGSDLDLVLLYRARRGADQVAKRIWYAVWDEGIHLDHSVRTRSEALAVARSDLKVLLGLLDARVVAGDERLAERLVSDVAALWRAKAPELLPALEQSMVARHREAGELAFLLEPDLKRSAGGLRDIAALRALAAAVVSLEPLAASPAIAEAEREILAARVVLHSRTGREADRLLLQEQDQVAELLRYRDADLLMARIAAAGQTVRTALAEGWRRARRVLGIDGSSLGADAVIGRDVVLRSGEVALAGDASPASDPGLLLRFALAAAERNTLLERESLDRLEAEAPTLPEPWPVEARETFVALLATGEALVPVVEVLDQRRLFERVLPEWHAVRSRPQRNAYHRYTVDRHLLEAVVRAGEYLGNVARPDLLLVGTLLHDLGKGFSGDHSEVGRQLAWTVGRRMGFDETDVAILSRLVAYHLVIPEFATRRDLDDPSTAAVVARIVEDRSTLELLAALVAADGQATGPAAWKGWKAELVAELVERVGRVLDGRPLDSAGARAPSEEQIELMAGGRLAIRANGRHLTVVAPDRPGLLATVAGVISLHRCNVRRASAYEGTPGMAIEVFDVEPMFERVPDWTDAEQDVAAALGGELDLDRRLAEQDRTYARGRRPAAAAPSTLQVLADNHTSTACSILEVRAPDRLGLLHRITASLAAAGCDVVSALVDTLGHEVVDTFYVKDQDAEKLSDATLAEVRAALEAALESGAGTS